MKHSLKIIGFLIFIYLFSSVDFHSLIIVISNINLLLLLISILFAFTLIYVKSFRWRYINISQNIIISVSKCYQIFTISSVLGSVTPGRVGEFLKIYSMKNYCADLEKRILGVLVDRLHDIIILLFTVFTTLFFVDTLAINTLNKYLFILFFIFLTIGIAYFFRNEILKVIIYNFYQFDNKNSKKIENKFISIFTNFKILFYKTFTTAFILTFLSYLLQVIISYSIIEAFGQRVQLHYIPMIISLCALVSLLPITIGGIGTREGIFVYILGLEGIPIEIALSISLINGIIIFTLIYGLLGSFFLIKNKFSFIF